MIKRPLCFVCSLFLMFQMIMLNMKGGQSLVEIPASSIFWVEDGERVCVTGEIYDKSVTPNTQILFLKNNSITYQEKSYFDSKIIVYDSKFKTISIGQTISLEGTISQFDIAHNPGNFDQALYYARSEIYGSIFCEKVISKEGEKNPLRESLYQLKQKWKQLLVKSIGAQKGNILSAMLLGEKREMDAETKELYQKNGIGHVLAISGLHISFIGLGIYRGIRKIGVPFLLSGILSMTILGCYTIMIGFSVSVFRAFVMLLIKVGADVTGRVYDMLTALMLSAALTVLNQPLYLTDAGFFLSYGAILGVLLILPPLEELVPIKKKWCSSLLSGLSVNMALFPIQLWYYYEFPLYSVFLNMLVIPLMSILMGAGMIGSGAFLVNKVLGKWILQICKLVLILYEWISKIGVRLPAANIVIGQPSIYGVLLYYAILVIVLSGMIQKKYLNVIGFCVASIVILWHPSNGIQITMLDVGQGDGIYIRGPTGGNYFIDGGSSDVKELGKYRLVPFLKSQGVSELDYVFISHGDLDHYSGIEEMLTNQDEIKLKNLVVAENYSADKNLLALVKLAKSYGTTVKVMKEGIALVEKELKFTCLQPKKEDGFSGNAGSMVLELDYNDFEMLCTGDVEEKGEQHLCTKIIGKSYEILKVAHHGSKYSTEPTFLKSIQGKVALISAGKDNSYGHPHSETLERLLMYHYQIYSTMEYGAITIYSNGKEMRIVGFH